MAAIKIIYDNNTVQKGFKPAWGFSCLVKYHGRNILFDTGGKADVLLSNLKALRVSPRSVTEIFISHSHWDHTGGLFGFLNINHKVKVFVPASFSRAYRNEIKATGAKCVGIKTFTRIAKDIYSSGELGEGIKEQSLIIDVSKGLIIITGCAHPGIIEIIKTVKKKLDRPILAVLGGFHLYTKSTSEIKKIITEFKCLGMAYAGPCHCSGEKAIRQFKAAYRDKFISVGAGSVVDVAAIKTAKIS
ncbi:MAG: MBL fold metallo-hydrolase [bacterium]